MSFDSFATRTQLAVNGKSYTYFSLPELGKRFDLSKLPYSMKILLENLLRHEDGGMTVGKDHIEAVAQWDARKEPDTEIAFSPPAWCCRILPACPAWSTSRRCAMPCPPRRQPQADQPADSV